MTPSSHGSHEIGTKEENVNFWKMNGAGNDFIIIDNRKEHIPEEKWPEIAQIICKRRMSVGSDGLMVVENPLGSGDFRMLFYNSDGSVGEMCGNGARCISRFGYENGLAGETQKIETTAGLVIGERIDPRNYRIRLNDPCNIQFNKKARIDRIEVEYSYVELGSPGIPHAAVEMPNLKKTAKEDLFELGRKLRYYEAFPKGANVNFYDILGEDHLFERTWERGVEDFTYACGTGTGAVVTILTLLSKVSGKGVQVDMEGGRLIIDVDIEGEKVKDLYLTGPTNIVSKGTITDEDLFL